MIRSSLQALISALPASVRPGPVSGGLGKRNGTPWPKMLGRLQTGPSERRPAAYSTSSASSSGSIASAPSMCSTAARVPSARQRRMSAALRQTATAPPDCRASRSSLAAIATVTASARSRPGVPGNGTA